MTRRTIAYLRPPDAYPLRTDRIPAGVGVVAVIAEPNERARDGLAQALRGIAAGEADTLLVLRLGAASESLGELVRLLDWLAEAGASLLALDVELDTADAAGRRTVELLRVIESWDRTPHPARKPRGRPGLATASPDVAERIAELRQGGLSLQAIADALNAQQIPTPRGGTTWRPSSVQAALGYRRPRPPVPGAPPPPPPPPPPHRRPPKRPPHP
jgi:Resolvase, N terminal domain/Recombinase